MNYARVRVGIAACAVMAGLVLLGLSTTTGCGLITAGVSLPEAFAHNGDLGLKGSICDESGQPVDEVLVTIKREYYLWHADASYSEYDTMTVAADHDFDVPARRAHQLDFTFSKKGYGKEGIVIDQEAIQAAGVRWVAGGKWPVNSPVRIIMARDAAPHTFLTNAAFQIDYTDSETRPLINLAASGTPMQTTVPAGAALPPCVLYADIQRQPLKTTGPERRVDPLDLNLPASLTLLINEPEAGFIPFTPRAGSSPLMQMYKAPEGGYVPSIVLSEKRLRQMRDPASSLVLDRNEFFYFHANSHYGKAVLNWSADNDNSGPLKFFLGIELQPDGSTNLADH